MWIASIDRIKNDAVETTTSTRNNIPVYRVVPVIVGSSMIVNAARVPLKKNEQVIPVVLAILSRIGHGAIPVSICVYNDSS